MLLSIEKFTNLTRHWNSRALTEDDFFKLCKKHKVTVFEMPLQVGGFYYCVLGRPYIAIDSRLNRWKKLFVMFHEFGHFLMHAPDRGVTANFHGIGNRTRKELEADAFATCALLPRPLIESRSIQELVEEDGYTEDLVLDRLVLFRTFDV
jgi:Zn-dependent peptidase ImmA (M78 family)